MRPRLRGGIHPRIALGLERARLAIAMAQDAYVGLCVTSHTTGTACTVVFDNVTFGSQTNNLLRDRMLGVNSSLWMRAEFEAELRDICRTYEIGVIPYSPLAGGFLTGKYRRNLLPNTARASSAKRYFTERNWLLLDLMDKMAKEKAAGISQLALAWLLADPLIVSPIIGANSTEQLNEDLGAVDLCLTSDEKSALDQATSWRN